MSKNFYYKDCNLAVVDIIQKEGITLTKRGKTYMGLCPFHPDKNPSMAVYENTGYFKCFACGESGDGITFVMRLKGFTFKQAVSYLRGWKNYKTSSKQALYNNSLWHKKKNFTKLFRAWESYYHNFLAVIYQSFIREISKFTSISEAEQFSTLYHQLPLIEYYLNILQGSDDKEKLALFRRMAYGKRVC